MNLKKALKVVIFFSLVIPSNTYAFGVKSVDYYMRGNNIEKAFSKQGRCESRWNKNPSRLSQDCKNVLSAISKYKMNEALNDSNRRIESFRKELNERNNNTTKRSENILESSKQLSNDFSEKMQQYTDDTLERMRQRSYQKEHQKQRQSYPSYNQGYLPSLEPLPPLPPLAPIR